MLDFKCVFHNLTNGGFSMSKMKSGKLCTNTPGTLDQIKKEVGKHSKKCGCKTFREETYRELRLNGFQPEEIVVEGCKIFTSDRNPGYG